MHIRTSGIFIELFREGEEVYVEFTLKGRLTHEDYETFVPFIESAIKDLPPGNLKILIDMREFKGWSLEAAWDDFKFGLHLRKDIDKMAVVGNREWEELFTRMAGWIISGKAKFFRDKEEARRWLTGR